MKAGLAVKRNVCKINYKQPNKRQTHQKFLLLLLVAFLSLNPRYFIPMKGIHLYCIGLSLICGTPGVWSASIENVKPPPPPPPPPLPPSDGPDTFIMDSMNETIQRDIIPPPPPPPLQTLGSYKMDGMQRPEMMIPNPMSAATSGIPPGTSDFGTNTRSFGGPTHVDYPSYSDPRMSSTSQYPYPPVYPSIQQTTVSQEDTMYNRNPNVYYPTQQQDPRYIQPLYQTSAYSQHRPPTRIVNPLQSQLVQRMTKTLDTFADVDDIAQDMIHTSATLVQKAAQTMKRTTQHAAGNVVLTGAAAASSIRGWMNRWQDQAWGALRGAPTQSDEAKSVWEEDRRVSIEANRRRRWLGGSSDLNPPPDRFAKSVSMGGTAGIQGGSPIQDAPYPTVVASTTTKELTPFQKQLASLALPPAKDHDEDSDIEEGEDVSSTVSADSSTILDRDKTEKSTDTDVPVSVQQGDPRDIFVTQGRFDMPLRTTGPIQSQSLNTYSSSDQIHRNDPINEQVIKAQKPSKPLKSKPMYERDDDENSSLSNKAGNLVRSIFTMIPLRFNLKGRKNHDWADSEWSDYNEDILKKAQQPVKSKVIETKTSVCPPLVDEIKQRQALQTQLIRRNTINLLSQREIKVCRDIGRAMAFFDFTQLILIFLAARLLKTVLPFSSLEIPKSLTQLQAYFKGLMGAVSGVNWMDSWFLHACVAAVLTGTTRDLLFRRKIYLLSCRMGTSMKENAYYVQLFSRLNAGYQVKPSLSDLLSMAAGEQVHASVAVSRLRSFFALTICTLILVALSVDSPFLQLMWKAMADISKIEVFRRWPIDWTTAHEALKPLMFSFFHEIYARARIIERMVVGDPLPIALNILFVSVLYVTSRMPNIANAVQMLNTSKRITLNDEKDDGEDCLTSGSSLLSNMGATSANRINILAPDGSLQVFLDRWRSSQQRYSVNDSKTRFLDPAAYIFRNSIYPAISIFLLMVPFAIQVYLSLNYDKPVDWKKLIDMSIINLATYGIAQESIIYTNRVFQFVPVIRGFYQRLAQINDMQLSHQKPNPRLPPPKDAASNTDGIEVRDLWVAHVSKRAWACKGISLCGRKGEITVILGDEASGKSRLVAALAESILNVPKLSRSTQIVRGSIYISGSDVLQWNPALLKRRVGVVMSNIRSLSDISQLLSGMTLHEILDPTISSGGSKGYASNQLDKSAVVLASEITSISSTLGPRLPPGKLSTAVTANEDDLKRSLNSTIHLLSSSDWEKIVLTRVLAQIISTNQVIGSSIKQSMEGAVLLLDDMGIHMNEIQQARLLKNLRKSGAATLITSYRWSVGRFADRIYVLQNGAIVENGTHSELLDRGPQKSIYAARWKEMYDESK